MEIYFNKTTQLSRLKYTENSPFISLNYISGNKLYNQKRNKQN